jgi:hypothetical protein
MTGCEPEHRVHRRLRAALQDKLHRVVPRDQRGTPDHRLLPAGV